MMNLGLTLFDAGFEMLMIPCREFLDGVDPVSNRVRSMARHYVRRYLPMEEKFCGRKTEL
jgi:hypothetical protein